MAIMVDLATIAFLLQRFRKHELAHPVDTLVAVLDCEMMGLAGGSVEDALFLSGRDELERECGDVVFLLFFAVDL